MKTGFQVALLCLLALFALSTPAVENDPAPVDAEPRVLVLALVPGWSEVTVTSVPDGARVAINGEAEGETPITLDMMRDTLRREAAVVSQLLGAFLASRA